MESFPYYLREQARELCSRLGIGKPGDYRQIIIHIALIAVFGLYFPWLKGQDFFDPVMTAAYACLGVLFAAPAAAQAFSGEPPGSMREAIARITVSVIYGELIAVVVLICGFATVYLTRSRYLVLAPDVGTLSAAGVLGITASFALAAAAAWISLRFSAQFARSALRAIYLLLLLLFFYRSRWLPDVADTAALVFLVIAIAEFIVLRRLIPRRSE